MLIYSKIPGARWWTALTIVACGYLLLNNTVYLDHRTPRFLLEKGAWADNPWWLAAFYFHIVGASVCLAAGIPLMFPQWTQSSHEPITVDSRRLLSIRVRNLIGSPASSGWP